MNVEIRTEAAQFPENEYINGIFVAVCQFDLCCYGRIGRLKQNAPTYHRLLPNMYICQEQNKVQRRLSESSLYVLTGRQQAGRSSSVSPVLTIWPGAG
jgi:hypothetical protein